MSQRILIGLLSFFGLLISLYFTLAYHKLATRFERYLPLFCRIEPEACTTLLATPEARLFGVPNFELGLLYYTGLCGSALLENAWKQMHLLLFFGSLVSVATGIYLTYVLLVRLRIHCALCYASHVINLAICLILLTSS